MIRHRWTIVDASSPGPARPHSIGRFAWFLAAWAKRMSDGVRRLEAAASADGAGTNYLVQHSAGSGKSNSIAWLYGARFA